MRECVPGHVTASALVLDHTGTQALLTLHPRFGRWLQLGGHCETGDPDIVSAAMREASEESGIADLTMDPAIAAIHVHPVTCSLGEPTRHLDLQFIAHAPAEAEIVCSDESLDLRWWPLDALPADTDDGLALAAAAGVSRAIRRVPRHSPQCDREAGVRRRWSSGFRRRGWQPLATPWHREAARIARRCRRRRRSPRRGSGRAGRCGRRTR